MSSSDDGDGLDPGLSINLETDANVVTWSERRWLQRLLRHEGRHELDAIKSGVSVRARLRCSPAVIASSSPGR
jgi:hypothetical protein